MAALMLSGCQESSPPSKPHRTPGEIAAIALENCRQERATLLQRHQAEIAAGQHFAAATTLRNCAQRLNDSELQAMIKTAEVAGYLSTIQNPKTLPFDRAMAMRALARDYPDVGSKYEAQADRIFREAERHAASADQARRRREGVSVGMTADDVLASSWGKPQRVRTHTSAGGVREQWVYGGGNYIYFQNGRVTSIQN